MSVPFKAGYAKVDITPSYPVPLAGYGNEQNRIHNNVLDPIYAICVAVSDGEKTLLFYHLDLTGFSQPLHEECCEKILKRYGIPMEDMLFNVTHTHSAPALGCQLESITRYKKELVEKLVDLAEPAIADLSPATIEIGSGQVYGLNYVRRYLLSDGSYGGDNFGDFKNNTILGHETEADHTMQVIRWVREEKKDIVMVNWQGHPHLTGGSVRQDLSSDLIWHFRDTVEKEHGVLFSFYQGCGGNINHHSRMESEPRLEHDESGRRLAAGLTPILKNLRPVKLGKIRTSMRTFTGPVNHSLDHLVDQAKVVKEFFETHTHAETAEFARSKGFNSVYHASAVIRRAEMPETYSFHIGAISFGDTCVVWAPNELYDVTGMYLKATSPFEMTFVCGYSNGMGHGYMPNIKAFAHGGYGCDTCRFGPGVTEKLTGEMLEEILKVKE